MASVDTSDTQNHCQTRSSAGVTSILVRTTAHEQHQDLALHLLVSGPGELCSALLFPSSVARTKITYNVMSDIVLGAEAPNPEAKIDVTPALLRV